MPAWCAQGQQYYIGCWLCACIVCTGAAVLYWLLIVCLHGVHSGNSTVLAAECAGDTGSVSCNGHNQSFILAAGCAPACYAEGQQYRSGCWLCTCMLCTGTAVPVLAAEHVPVWCAQGQQYCTVC